MKNGGQLHGLDVDADLFNAIAVGTASALRMADVVPRPVGCSILSAARHNITVLVGLAGRYSGNLAINLASEAMLFLTSRFLGEEQAALSEDSVDAIMEAGNILAGAVKRALADTQYSLADISLPSLVMGPDLNMPFARGLRTVSVEFEIDAMPLGTLQQRFMSSSISLMQTTPGPREA